VITILHASDLHFGKPYDAAVGRAFMAAAHETRADVIVVSGDFTQRAKEREYREARAFLDELPRVPLVVTPGNHDVPLYRVAERLLDPWRNYRKWISEELDTVTRVAGAVIVSLNTAAPRRAIVNGRLRPEQLDFARSAFEATATSPGSARILVAHHHLAPAPDYEGDKPLPGARGILDELEALEVDLALGGHLHRAYIGNSLDVYAGIDRSHGIIIAQSGTTTSRRGRAREQAKNSYNVIRVQNDHVEITHFMHFAEVDGFAPFSTHAFPRGKPAYFREDPFGRDGALGTNTGSKESQ
jgi:3',5'-cyclic AMP phosphodiesterase CpdA